MNQEPVIVFVDDEPHNLVVFEAALPSEWKVHVFDSPLAAVENIESLNPTVIVSDQRMPGMKGVKFLELASKLVPNAVRILVTGYTDEDLIIESVRAAKIFDYIRKPWDSDELVKRLGAGIEHSFAVQRQRALENELLAREKELVERNTNLLKVMQQLEASQKVEREMRAELECWVPPFVLRALSEKQIQFPIKRDLVGITFDIIRSSEIHDKVVKGRSLRAQVLQLFSEAIIRHGGWRESQAGDSAYGHFGLLQESENPADAALAVAREFRVGLRNLAQINSIDLECGISLHTAKNCVVDIHTVQLHTPHGLVVQKSFDTTSSDVDLLHRMEKLVHDLPGSNIVMSKSFVEALKYPPQQLVHAGHFQFAGQKDPAELYLILSDRVNSENLERFKAKAIGASKQAG